MTETPQRAAGPGKPQAAMSVALEFDAGTLRPGENRLPCPRRNKGKRDDALAVKLRDNSAIVWTCHRCGWAGAHGRETKAPRPKPAPVVLLSQLWDAWLNAQGGLTSTAQAAQKAIS